MQFSLLSDRFLSDVFRVKFVQRLGLGHTVILYGNDGRPLAPAGDTTVAIILLGDHSRDDVMCRLVTVTGRVFRKNGDEHVAD